MCPEKPTAIQGKHLAPRFMDDRQTMEVGMSQLPTSRCRVFFPPEDYSTDVCSTSIHNAPLPDAASPTRFKAPFLLTA
ncbi:hypothetical protein QF010_000164 [Pseudomonas silensiensis]